jgi:2-oxoglutarate ferredoxin oxidoreductase subunit beta
VHHGNPVNFSVAHRSHICAKSDFQTNQEVRWCPGCGDYAILNAAQQVFAQLGFPKHKMVMISGIGCSSRFPYYVNTYGFHTIHGRAPILSIGETQRRAGRQGAA